MSERDVELTRRYIKAFNTRDIEAFLAYRDPSIEFHTAFAPAGGIYHGHDGLRTFLRDVGDAWGDELLTEPEAYFDLGEHTLVFNALHGRGRLTGVELTTPVTQVLGWRDGLLVYFRSYARKDDALSDLGITEDDLEPIEP